MSACPMSVHGKVVFLFSRMATNVSKPSRFVGDVGQIPSRIKDSNPEAGNCYASLQMLIFLNVYYKVCVWWGWDKKK